MNFEDMVKECMKKYPQLFLDRWEVLNYLFCTLHCDHTWVNGQLTGEINTNCKLNTPLYGEQIIELNRFREKLWRQAYYIYPLGRKYSNLFNFPQNIKSDWLEGILETTAFIIENMDEQDDVYMEVSHSELKRYYTTTLMPMKKAHENGESHHF